jgi:GNAT superfamily N-acetyltransferase
MDRDNGVQLQREAVAGSVTTFAAGTAEGRLLRLDGVTAAINPGCAQRSIVNSATYRDAAALAGALPELAREYADAGIAAHAIWSVEPSADALVVLEDAGYVLDSEPAGMTLELASDFDADPGELDWDAEGTPQEAGQVNNRAYGYPEGEGVAGAIGDAPPGMPMRTYRARVDGDVAAVLRTFDVGTDCHVGWVATLPEHRGKRLASGLMAAALADARDRGLRSSTLQASMLGRGVYERLGYRVVCRLQLHEKRET